MAGDRHDGRGDADRRGRSSRHVYRSAQEPPPGLAPVGSGARGIHRRRGEPADGKDGAEQGRRDAHGTRPHRRPRRLLTHVLLLAGLGLIAGAVALIVVDQRPSIAHELGLSEEEVPYPSRLRPSASPSHSAMPKKDRVVIPAIGLDAVINHGEGSVALQRGVWHQPNGASPPTKGNSVLAGHRVKDVFLLLSELEPGDEIIVYWKQREYDYRVVSVFDTDPDDEAIVRCGSTRALTLYTCVPRYEGDRRTVVVAEPI